MRGYRAKHGSTPRVSGEGADLRQANERIASLEAELARLKLQFGIQASPIVRRPPEAAMREFRPVPKPSQKTRR
jgi:hypothetical protein